MTNDHRTGFTLVPLPLCLVFTRLSRTLVTVTVTDGKKPITFVAGSWVWVVLLQGLLLAAVNRFWKAAGTPAPPPASPAPVLCAHQITPDVIIR